MATNKIKIVFKPFCAKVEFSTKSKTPRNGDLITCYKNGLFKVLEAGKEKRMALGIYHAEQDVVWFLDMTSPEL